LPLVPALLVWLEEDRADATILTPDLRPILGLVELDQPVLRTKRREVRARRLTEERIAREPAPDHLDRFERPIRMRASGAPEHLAHPSDRLAQPVGRHKKRQLRRAHVHQFLKDKI